jgi:hypothetical protein
MRPGGPMSYERYAELVPDLWERGVLDLERPQAAHGVPAPAPRRVRSV